MVSVCVECGSGDTVKYGKRESSSGSKKQLYYCNSCGSKFTEPGFRQKSYSGKVILTALKLYGMGFSLSKVSSRVNRRFKVNTSRSTVYNWVNEYRTVCSLLQNREKFVGGFSPDGIIDEYSYFHSGLEYPFRVHKVKLKLAEKYGLESLVEFLGGIDESICHEMFEDSVRSSQSDQKYPDIQAEAYKNNACSLAKLALQANSNRNKRHEVVQDLMLKTDKATLATEVPVWYYNKELEDTVTGHIDILQARSNTVYILDYKPKAEKVEPLGQLENYVKALSYRTGLPRGSFKAAWFNEKVYKEVEFS